MGLFLKDGTRVTAATIATTPDPNPIVSIDTDLFVTQRSGREDDKPDGELKMLFCRAGRQMRQNELDAMFHSADVDSVVPATGGTAGGTVVTLSGNYLDTISAATVGGVAATVTRVSDRECKVTTGAHAAGLVDIVLTDDRGTTTLTGAYTYV